VRYTARFEALAPFGFLGETWFLAAASVLFLANLFLDKIFTPGDSLSTPPGERDRRLWLGTAHDLGQIVLGPVSAIVVMAASDRAYGFFPSNLPLVAPMIGMLLAGLFMAGKRTLRHRLADRWGPFSNLFLGVLEDAAVVLLCGIGILLR
jgi:hypothetical protein